MSPTATTIIPIINNQPDIGSNNTSNIPSPKPIKHTASVFFNSLHIFITSHLLYIILGIKFICYLFMPTFVLLFCIIMI